MNLVNILVHLCSIMIAHAIMIIIQNLFVQKNIVHTKVFGNAYLHLCYKKFIKHFVKNSSNMFSAKMQMIYIALEVFARDR